MGSFFFAQNIYQIKGWCDESTARLCNQGWSNEGSARRCNLGDKDVGIEK